jgi:osmotically-inducible protein OsmY
MKSAALIVAAGLCLAGCSSDQGNSGSSQVSSDQNSNMVRPSDNSADNSAVTASNREYPNNGSRTIQGQTASDLQMTSDIHRRISDQNLTNINASSVVVVTNNGFVTLTGSVPSEQDRVAVGRAAGEIAGTDHVDNEVTVSRTH